MENVLTNKNEIRGFINKNGVFIKITSIDLGGDSVEMVAESLLRDFEKCTKLTLEIKHYLKSFTVSNRIFQLYLVEKYGYIYIHVKYLDDRVDIEELICPSNQNKINEQQRKQISKLCKGMSIPDNVPKVLEIQKKMRKSRK